MEDISLEDDPDPLFQWLDLLGVAGADLVDVVPCGEDDESAARFDGARPGSALGARWHRGAPPRRRGRAMLRSATRRLQGLAGGQDGLFDRCLGELLPRVDPELVGAVGAVDRGVLRAAFFDSLFASALPESDAAGVWRALLEEERPEGMAAAALCVLLVRCRAPLLAFQIDDDADMRRLYAAILEASCVRGERNLVELAAHVLDPHCAAAEVGVDVVSFGPGPLGILLTRKARGLVISNFSSAERVAAPKPRVGDTLLAVNGRALPRGATLADAVTILKAVGRPVLVAFRNASAHELAADAAEDRAKRAAAAGANAPPPPPAANNAPPGGGPKPKSQSNLSQFVSAVASAVEPFPFPSARDAVSSVAGGHPAPPHHGDLPGGAPARLDPLPASPVAADGYELTLLAGEVVFGKCACSYQDWVVDDPRRSGALSGMTLSGELYATSYRVVFHPIGVGVRPSFARKDSDDWEMPCRALLRCDLGQLPGAASTLAFACKDGQRRKFSVAERLGGDALRVARAVHALAFSKAPDAFAKAHFAGVRAAGTNNAWGDDSDEEAPETEGAEFPGNSRLPRMHAYTLVTEYVDYVLRPYVIAEYPRRGLRLVTQGENNLALCDTYPPDLVVPASMSDLELRRVAAYRSKGRLPAVVWAHPDPTNGATISRSAQPKPGVQNKRSADDERYLDELRRFCHGKRMVIVDARSKVAAQGNRVMGGGTELARYYENVELFYGNIANIHAARDALSSLQALCRDGSGGNTAYDGGATWLGKLEGTKWLSMVHAILASAAKTVDLVHYERCAVLVHCSDGWDRTPQITVLAMVMLEARFRTMDGFLALVQKEWADFGHKFDERCGHTDESGEDQRSPVFLLFADAMVQLLHQFPARFEFTADLLVALLDQLFACRYGTFLDNCFVKRDRKKIHAATAPLWWYFHEHRAKFLNGAYDEDEGPPLIPSLQPKNVVFFDAYFRRFDNTAMPPRAPTTYY
ncbi:phosphatidylinositol-3,5-bisphosphate 3-phosphatase [Aureococcus anophagefferens]|nr:phosphatidylinositol-3,5-bisphosphate 3-phosphatase [Aureococcus anophagefferens]